MSTNLKALAYAILEDDLDSLPVLLDCLEEEGLVSKHFKIVLEIKDMPKVKEKWISKHNESIVITGIFSNYETGELIVSYYLGDKKWQVGGMKLARFLKWAKKKL